MNTSLPQHVAIIMDGNGRWAKKHNRKRVFGHMCGKKIMDHIVEYASNHNIKFLSLFAFSTENWNRPSTEINFIMKLLASSVNKNTINNLNKNNISFHWIGFEKPLPKAIINKLKSLEQQTKKNSGMNLNLCFNYGGMQDILQAAKKTNRSTSLSQFNELLLTKGTPPVDLLIRTGNEKRISNFLIWQCAYAEIIFEKKMWPDYTCDTFKKNLLEFNRRHRRYGAIHE